MKNSKSRTLLTLLLIFVLTIGCLGAIYVFTSGQEKLTDEGRVQGDTFTFTTAQFQKLYEETYHKQLGTMTEKKLEGYDTYYASTSIKDVYISTKTHALNDLVTSVDCSISASDSSSADTLSFSSSQLGTIKKQAVKLFKICSPNVSTKEFTPFLDKMFAPGTKMLLTGNSQDFGDITVTVTTYGSSLYVTFEPKSTASN